MKLQKYNFALLILPVLIFALGFVMLLSTSPERAKTQLIYFFIGYFLYILVSSIDYTIYKYYWKHVYFVILGFLLLTFILGEVRLGAVRWISVGFLNLQPSEFAKIVLIISLSAFLSIRQKVLAALKDWLHFFIIFVPVTVLVLMQPDLGTAIVFFALTGGILFFAGLNRVYFLLAFLLMGIFSSPIWNMLHYYQKKRILVFLNPSLDILGSGYNVIQAVIAVGSGGLWGKGFGRGTQSHLNFLPAHWTDFALASFAEEWGFIGVCAVVILFTLLLLTLLYIAMQDSDSFGSLLVIGVFMVFFTQFVVNVGMNLGIMPVTGIPLPLFSYGGSSLLTSMILLGVAQSVWMSTQGR